MSKNRMEAFSDGVIAIIITIMVLELHIPHGVDWNALRPVLPSAATYLMSFVFLALYWNNHHHMLHMADRINGKILWANMHLLFWLSLVPFVTGWMGGNDFASLPTALYGAVLILSALAYRLLQGAIVASQGRDSRLGAAIGNDRKGGLSLALYATAIPLAFLNRWVSVAIYAFVALMWLVPDPRIESKLKG
jgi:uncharacterized membrane protein